MNDTATLPPPALPQTPIRMIVRGGYDLQALRIMMGNRIVAQFKAKLGQQPGHTEEEDLGEEEQDLLKDLRADYKTMMEGVKSVKLATFKATPLISTYTEFCLLQGYLELVESEKRAFSNLGKILDEYPIYSNFLSKVKGIGPAIAGVIISEIDIHKARHPSSIHQYCGLGVEADGRGTSKRKEHMHERTYTDKEGKPAVRMGIRHNPFLKSKMCSVMGTSFLRAGDNPYRTIYLDYKNRLQNHPNWTDKTKGHIHAAAIRYMVKIFLTNLYVSWRTLEGLPVSLPYAEAKLGIKHGEGSNTPAGPGPNTPAQSPPASSSAGNGEVG